MKGLMSWEYTGGYVDGKEEEGEAEGNNKLQYSKKTINLSEFLKRGS
jgi:hypothetical protein